MEALKRPKKLAEKATEVLRNSIIDNTFFLGESLSEKILANSLGISKSPVREALLQLKIEGLVTIVPQKGTFVFTVTEQELYELIYMRLVLEVSAVDLSFQNNKTAFIASLQKSIDRMSQYCEQDDIQNYVKWDTTFHESFFDFCDNRYLCAAYQQITGKCAALRVRISNLPGHINKTFLEHEKFVQYICEGYIDLAKSSLKDHLSSFEKFYQKYAEAAPVSSTSSTRKSDRYSKVNAMQS